MNARRVAALVDDLLAIDQGAIDELPREVRERLATKLERALARRPMTDAELVAWLEGVSKVAEREAVRWANLRLPGDMVNPTADRLHLRYVAEALGKILFGAELARAHLVAMKPKTTPAESRAMFEAWHARTTRPPRPPSWRWGWSCSTCGSRSEGFSFEAVSEDMRRHRELMHRDEVTP